MPDDAEPEDDQAFTHDAVSFRFSDQKPWGVNSRSSRAG
jgi:hypothetical protein